MNEANMTINHRELSQAQSKAVRSAVMTFLASLHDPRINELLGQLAIDYHRHLIEVMAMIDETPAESEEGQ